MTKKVNISTTPGADIQVVNEAVARRLRDERKLQKISLDELARRAGVSKGMVVEIENCKANPSIAILCKITAVLGISVADAVNVASTPAARLIEPEDILTLWNGPSGGNARLLAGTSGPHMVELWKWELQPGEEFEADAHPPGTFELFHVDKGTLTLQVENTQLIIKAGSSAIARTDVPHRYINAHDDGLVFTMTVVELH